jgi:hypothetical protein
MIENIIINIIMAVSSLGVLVAAVIFNVNMPMIVKGFEEKIDRAFFITAAVMVDTLLLCAMILFAKEFFL